MAYQLRVTLPNLKKAGSESMHHALGLPEMPTELAWPNCRHGLKLIPLAVTFNQWAMSVSG